MTATPVKPPRKAKRANEKSSTTKKSVKGKSLKDKSLSAETSAATSSETPAVKPAKASVKKNTKKPAEATKKTVDKEKIKEGESWYDYPQYYDLGFRDNNKLEIKFFEKVFEKFIPGEVKKVLEPGCGTGRLVYEMAKKGYEMTGLDLNANALEYAQKRLERNGLAADLIQGDMADFKLPTQFDAAFNTINTFRHLITEDLAVKHLKLIAKHLRPGGIYILGFHLFPPDCDPYGSERWKAKQGKTEASFSLTVLDSSRKTRVENLKITMTIRKPNKTIRLHDSFPLRLYTAAQVKSLFAKVPELKLRGIYDFWYEIDEPQKLDNQIVDAVFLLQK